MIHSLTWLHVCQPPWVIQYSGTPLHCPCPGFLNFQLSQKHAGILKHAWFLVTLHLVISASIFHIYTYVYSFSKLIFICLILFDFAVLVQSQYFTLSGASKLAIRFGRSLFSYFLIKLDHLMRVCFQYLYICKRISVQQLQICQYQQLH